jgi:hypothetical protein
MPVSDPLALPIDTSPLIIVTRDFNGGGVQRFRGEIVDTTGWLFTHTLINRRYASIVPYGYDMDASVVVKIDGEDRRFTHKDYADHAVATSADLPPSSEPEPVTPASTPAEPQEAAEEEQEQPAATTDDEIKAEQPKQAPRQTTRKRTQGAKA